MQAKIAANSRSRPSFSPNAGNRLTIPAFQRSSPRKPANLNHSVCDARVLHSESARRHVVEASVLERWCAFLMGGPSMSGRIGGYKTIISDEIEVAATLERGKVPREFFELLTVQM